MSEPNAEMGERERVEFYGSKRGRLTALLDELPQRVQIGDECFVRVDDPETHLPLGAYVLITPPVERETDR